MDTALNFIFLRFPDNPIQSLQFDDSEIDGFEQYLADVTEVLENFDYDTALSNMAVDKGYPPKGAGFKFALLCGYGKWPGHSKKTGAEYWVCDYKWPKEYWALINEDGKTVQSSFNKKDLKKKKGCKIKKMSYSGCPKWINTPEYLGWLENNS
jgi:hypothetical protein